MIYFAHRGLSDYAPENTIAAFEMAVKAGAKAIEMDVQRSADGQLVVAHDFYLDRTSQGIGLLKDKTYEELATYDAGGWFHFRFVEEKMPLLEEVLQTIPEDVLLNIELKRLGQERENDFAQKVVDLLKKYPRRYLLSSFDHELLKEVQDLDSTIPLGLLYCSNLIDVFYYLQRAGLKVASINPSIEYVNPELVAEAHQRGIKVFVYTVHNKTEYDYLKEMDVDGIFVNSFDFIEQ